MENGEMPPALEAEYKVALDKTLHTFWFGGVLT
jgi:hypothetical protein